MSATVGYVVVINENTDNEICEWFLVFNSTDESNSKGLTDVILKFLGKNKLELKHCMGQGTTMLPTLMAKLVVCRREF
jgi:hypothetical protein